MEKKSFRIFKVNLIQIMLAHAHIVKELIHRLGVFVGIISAEEHVVQAKDVHGHSAGRCDKNRRWW